MTLQHPPSFKKFGHHLRPWHDNKDAKKWLDVGSFQVTWWLDLKDRRSPLLDIMQNWWINSHAKFRSAMRRDVSAICENLKGAVYQPPPVGARVKEDSDKGSCCNGRWSVILWPYFKMTIDMPSIYHYIISFISYTSKTPYGRWTSGSE